MSTFKFEPATREGVKPLIGLYGESNSGKTFSALLLARGLAGENGKIMLIDTESGRGSLYADEVPRGYMRTDFQPPFSPERYCEALDAAESAGADVVVFDSFSAEWVGEGGVLDIAGDNEAAGKKGLSVWKAPKISHQKLILRLMRSKTFVIVCLRAKYKSKQTKKDGRTEIIKDDHVSPIQDDELLFEMTCHCEMQTGKPGTIRLTKWSIPDLAECFPKDGEEQLSIKHGELIAKWASGPRRVSKPQPNAAPPGTEADRKKAKTAIWTALKEKFSDAATRFHDEAAIEQELWDGFYMLEDETLATCTPARLLQIAAKLASE